jgi:hypothetical protein
MLIKAIKSSKHAETNRDKKSVRWGVITNFTEEVDRLYCQDLLKLAEFIGMPIERFNHNVINTGDESANFIYVIASGLSPIVDRIEKIHKRIETLEALRSDGKNIDGDLIGVNQTLSEIMSSRKGAANKGKVTVPEKVNLMSIMDEF